MKHSPSPKVAVRRLATIIASIALAFIFHWDAPVSSNSAASNTASAAENIFLSAPVPESAPEPPALAAAPFWVASTLSAGGIAIIGVNTEDVIPGGATANDTITFILLKPIGSGTVIFFSDRNWNGTTFPAAGGGDSTFTYTAATDLPAGTVVTITQAQLTTAGMALSSAGETIYAYQGAINAPTVFLHAVDLADGNTVFDGNELLNTGLVTGTSAIALSVDNAEMGTRSHNINVLEYLKQVNNNTDWAQNDNSPQDGTVFSPDGTHALTAPDSMVVVAGSGAGEAIVTINLDATYNSGTIGYQIVQAFQNAANLFHPSDITLDTVNDKYFFVDADLNGNNRIIQGSISELLNNPGQVPTFTILYSNTGTGAVNSMRTLSIDTANQKIYFDLEQAFVRINYNTAGQTPTVLRDLEPIFGAASYITQMTINYTTGTVYLGSSSIISVFGTDFVDSNRVFVATGLTGSNAANSMTFTEINWGANGDTTIGPEGAPLGNNHWPVERGTVRGVDIDPTTGLLWIATGTVILDNDGNGLTTYRGGVWTYNTSTGAVTNMYQQTGSPGAPSGPGPNGILYYIEADSATGRYYVVDETGINAQIGDGGVWTGSLTTPGTPTLVATVGNFNGLGPQGLEIQHAPTLTGSAVGGLTVTEASSAPLSGETNRVTLFTGLAADDIDTPNTGDELAGALVRISDNFQFGVTHQDQLRINGNLSGTVAGSNINYSYDSNTGQMTLSGPATTAEYVAALHLVQFSTSGDNVTNYGTATNRTVKVSVFDGLLYSPEISAVVNVTGINDAPVNNGMTGTFSGGAFVEDAIVGAALTGITISDVDADPASQNLVFTFSVAHGTLTFLTNVAGGIVPGDITGGANGSTTVTITATQNEMNATLGAANGLTYIPTTNFNGNDTLTVVSNDQGLNGNDPGNSGTGTTEQDTDNKTIFVSAVNDAPVRGGDGTEDAAQILEDQPSAAGQAVSVMFGALFSDAADNQTAFSGSAANAFAGIAIHVNNSNANGEWQYFNAGTSTWVNIGSASLGAARLISASTSIRFNPAANFNGAAPTLAFFLVDDSGGGLINGATVDANSRGGTTRISIDGVTLSQQVAEVNDAPTATADPLTSVAEDSGQRTITIASLLANDLKGPANENAQTLTLTGVSTAVGGTVSHDVTNVYFTPAADFNGAASFEYTITDDGTTNGSADPLTSTGTVSFSVTAVNDAPALNAGATPALNAVAEDAGAPSGAVGTLVSSLVDLTGGGGLDNVTEVDSTPVTGIAVTGVNITNGTWHYTINGGTNWFPLGAVTDDAARFLAADAGTRIYFQPSLNFNGAVTSAITFRAWDQTSGSNGGTGDPSPGGGTSAFSSDSDTADITVTAVNDAPVFAGLNNTPTFTEDGAAVVLDNDATISDVELDAANNYNGATLTLLRNGGTNSDDVFGSTGTLSLTAGNVVLSGTTVGTFTNTGGTLAITFNSSATSAGADSVLQQLTYSNSSQNPPASVQINYTFNDGNSGAQGTGGNGVANGSITVNITQQNDAPVLDLDANNSSGATGADYTALYVPLGPTVPVTDTDDTITDVDDTNMESATVTLTNPQANDSLTVNGALPAGITLNGASTTSNIILNGSSSLANYQTALRQIVFSNSNANPGTTPRSITSVVNDGNTNSNIATTTITLCITNPLVTSTADSGAGSLRQAILDACPGSTITFDTAGVFATPQTITLASELSIARNLTIDGPDAAGNHVTVSGGGASRVFNINAGQTVAISDLTMTGGNSGSNGAIRTDGGTLTLTNSTVSGNQGGGIFIDASGSVTVRSSTISGNSAPGGGAGITCDNTSTLNLINSTLSANNTPGSGGGIATFNGCIATSTNSTITNNTADSDNNATGTGGGIFNGSGTVTMHNTIVAGNFNEDGVTDARDDINGAIDSLSSFNLIGDGTGMTGITNGTNNNQVGSSGTPIDPLLDALQNNGGTTFTHALLYNSPAVDKGDNTVTGAPLNLTTDQRGLARNVDGDLVAGAVVDIGAYERQDPESRPVAPGSNVNIDLNDAQFTFPSVSGGGVATIEVLDPDAQGTPPAGFSIGTHPQPAGCAANPSQAACLPAFNVSTTATYTGPVGICFYLPAITNESFFDGLKILHNEAGVLVDRTTGQNFAAKLLCGSVPTLSPFVIAHAATPTSANGDISGQITDANGKPVEGAVVRLTGAQTRKTITDAKGRYYFDNIAANGFYTVTPARTNYGFNPTNRSFNQLGNHTEAGFAGSFNGDNTNPLDTPEYFVRQQYVDLLGREPDEGGFNYWSDEILRCGSDAICVNARRRDVAAAFFIEQEFQQSGAFIYNLYKGSLGRKPAYGEYAADRRQVVGGPSLDADKVAFADSFVQRPEFLQKYQAHTTPESFVDALLKQVWESSKVDLAGDRSLLLALYQKGGNTIQSRSLVLRHLVADPNFTQAEHNAAFVLTEYFGYLRRNPEPEGYDFWLHVLSNREVGNFSGMVCSFITSTEYQKRFSSVVTHSNAECGR